MNKKFFILATVLAASVTAVFGQIKMHPDGKVIVGQAWGVLPSRTFEVKGLAHISQVPDNPTLGYGYSGVNFMTHPHTYLHNGIAYNYESPIMRPQWDRVYWIGEPNYQMWRVYSEELYSNLTLITSDERRKTNFKTVDNSLERILGLKSYTFDYKPLLNEKDSLSTLYKGRIQNSGRNQVGYKAQDLLEYFPHLVYYDRDVDVYSVNYVGLIPELTKAVQELNAKIEALKAEIEMLEGNCCDQSNKSTNKENLGTPNGSNLNGEADQSLLYQNNPNPFNVETNIKYYLAPSIGQAVMYIYDMNGRQIDKYDISKKGEGRVTIQKNNLQAGIYYYTLIADGKEVATKKMILTE